MVQIQTQKVIRMFLLNDNYYDNYAFYNQKQSSFKGPLVISMKISPNTKTGTS